LPVICPSEVVSDTPAAPIVTATEKGNSVVLIYQQLTHTSKKKVRGKEGERLPSKRSV